MNRDRVDQLLQDYLENKGRYEHLTAAINEQKMLLAGLQSDMRADLIYATADQDGMPKPKGNISRPTENIAVKLADGYETKQVSEARDELARMIEEQQQLEPCVAYVEAWISSLTDRENWVIRNKVFEKKHWPEMIDPFREKFVSSGCSKDSLKRIRDNAMQKIYRIADVN